MGGGSWQRGGKKRWTRLDIARENVAVCKVEWVSSVVGRSGPLDY